LTLKLKVGKKGYIILPKALREAVGIREGDEVTVELGDGIILKPARRVDPEEIRRALAKHLKRIMELPGLVEPKPDELGRVCLEEEFAD